MSWVIKLYEYRSFRVFYEEELQNYLDQNNKRIRNKIKSESDEYILNVNEIEYVNYLLTSFNVDLPQIDFEEIFVDSIEKKIESERFPVGFFVDPGESYPKPVVVYHVPFNGKSDLLKYRPNPCVMWSTTVYIQDNCICFDVIDFRSDPNEIKREAKSVINSIKKQYTHFSNQIQEYNRQLQIFIESNFEGRKEQILKKNQTLASLGVPIKKKRDLPATYSIPTPNIRKKISIRPEVTEREYKPEPALENSTYFEILKLLNSAGKVFEKYPSIYTGKGEEELRDHLLFHLQPQFEGSVTGETFNKSGKTDILIKYNDKNIFIAECKFWKGIKSYLDAITQLLNYLTWRDSKAALVIFVKNKEISSILKKVKEKTHEHSNYLGYVNNETESWFNYRFHINGDRNREVKLAVLIFHIPIESEE